MTVPFGKRRQQDPETAEDISLHPFPFQSTTKVRTTIMEVKKIHETTPPYGHLRYHLAFGHRPNSEGLDRRLGPLGPFFPRPFMRVGALYRYGLLTPLLFLLLLLFSLPSFVDRCSTIDHRPPCPLASMKNMITCLKSF
jgi:hypothetical protein